MNIIANISFYLLVISLFLLVIWGIRWILGRKKEHHLIAKKKRETFIALGLLVVSLIIFASATTYLENEYTKDKNVMLTQYLFAWGKINLLSSDQLTDWEKTVKKNNNDYDTVKATPTLRKSHSEDKQSIQESLKQLQDLDQKIQKNTAVDDKEKQIVHTAYLNITELDNQARILPGSYNQFVTEYNKLDKNVDDSFNALKKLANSTD